MVRTVEVAKYHYSDMDGDMEMGGVVNLIFRKAPLLQLLSFTLKAAGYSEVYVSQPTVLCLRRPLF